MCVEIKFANRNYKDLKVIKTIKNSLNYKQKSISNAI